MTTKLLSITSVILGLMIGVTSIIKVNSRQANSIQIGKQPSFNMPIVDNDPLAHLAHGGIPEEQRDEKYRKWLSTGLKILVPRSSGSGTIVHYDYTEGWAYVQSCGHLWNGVMEANEGRLRKLTCTVVAQYHNQTKLITPKKYPAEVIYYSNSRGQDCSLLRFKPDWIPDYLPIAPEDYKFTKDTRLHSVGCDSGTEVAHYDVRVLGLSGGQNPDLETTENSPRPGRSGGGLMNEDYFLGVCWGTSNVSGEGNGFFTPLKTIRELNTRNGYGWLNDVGLSWARQIPIVDRNNPQDKYPKNYIPLPQN